MNKLVCRFGVLLLAGLAPTASVLAVDSTDGLTPAEVARRTIHRLNAIGDRTTGAIQDLTGEAVPRIRRLVLSGHHKEAEALAHRSIHRVRGMASDALGAIRHITERSHRILHRLNARPALHEAVNAAAHENVDSIRHATARSVHAIRAALNR